MEIRCTKKTAYTLAFALFGIVLCCAWIVLYAFRNSQWYTYETYLLFASLQGYIEENEGQFPANEDDLVSQGFLRKTEVPDGTAYEVRAGLGPRVPWHRCYLFPELTVAYGVQAQNIEVRDNQLCDKMTDQRLYLIDGPRKWPISHIYAGFSKDLYEIMLNSRARTPEEPR